ncbi:MAG: PQQ-dependent sugar dehydrogenase [Rhodothermales bacterium]
MHSSPVKLFVAFMLAGLVAAAPLRAQNEVIPSVHHDYRIVELVEGLENPWSLAFLPNGDMLVTERPGRLRLVSNGMLVDEPVSGVPAVHAVGQGGLLEVALHPNFSSNRLVYLTMSKANADTSESTTSVVRGRYENGALTDVEEVFEAAAWSERNGHYGSRIVFDADGYLFITIGDRQAPPSGDLEAHPAQDLSTHQGTIVRLHDDGSVPSDNPFVDEEGALPEIWSYGHRSPQGFAIHPETGDLWETEHGPQGGDELNLIEPGLNYGWPVIGYGVNYGSGDAIHSTTTMEGMEQPDHIWVPSIATSGLAAYSGSRFPEWQGDLFAGGLRGMQLARLDLNGPEVVREETLVLNRSRIRDVRQGPDGYIYLVYDNAGEGTPSVVRLEPAN